MSIYFYVVPTKKEVLIDPDMPKGEREVSSITANIPPEIEFVPTYSSDYKWVLIAVREKITGLIMFDSLNALPLQEIQKVSANFNVEAMERRIKSRFE